MGSVQARARRRHKKFQGRVETRFGSDFQSKYEQIVKKLEKSFNTNDKGGV